MTSRSADSAALLDELVGLPLTQRRPQLRNLMPVLDGLARQGVPHDALAQALQAHGLAIKAASLRQALWRWRKRHPAQRHDAPPAAVALPPGGPDPLGGVDAAPFAQPASLAPITSKADLAKLRNRHIDLNALASLGRKK